MGVVEKAEGGGRAGRYGGRWGGSSSAFFSSHSLHVGAIHITGISFFSLSFLFQ